MKTVIHVHTNYSPDSNVSPAELIQAARRAGVECLAITDHDEIDGALEARALGGVQVVVGEEVSSAAGHVLGLFLHERIPPQLSVEQTAQLIRAQGGLVLAPHPRAVLCRNSLSEAALRRLLPWLDGVEVVNAQNPLWWEDAWARAFAQRTGLTAFVGADAHLRGYLAAAYQELPPFEGPAGFRQALQQAELHPGRFGLGYVGLMAVHHVWQRVFRRPFPGCGANAAVVQPAGGRPAATTR